MAIERVAMITFRDQAQRPIVTFRRMDGVVTVETWAQGVHGETPMELAELRQLVNFLGDIANLPWDERASDHQTACGQQTPTGAQDAPGPQDQPKNTLPIPQPAGPRPPRTVVPTYVERPTWGVSEPAEDDGMYPITGAVASS